MLRLFFYPNSKWSKKFFLKERILNKQINKTLSGVKKKLFVLDWLLVSYWAFALSSSNSIIFDCSSASLNLYRAQSWQSNSWTPGNGDENVLKISYCCDDELAMCNCGKPALRSMFTTLARSSCLLASANSSPIGSGSIGWAFSNFLKF